MKSSNVTFNDPEHPNTPLADWNSFQKEFSPYIFESVIDRKAAQLPEWFVPLARGAGIASPYLLREAGYRPGLGLCPAEHTTIEPDACHLELWYGSAVVRRFGFLWTVEWRVEDRANYYKSDHTLVYLFGSTPILARSREEASYLAVDFIAGIRQGYGLRWINAQTIDEENAIRFLKKRTRDEARTESKMMTATTTSKRVAKPTTGSARP
jgi:hypothetical protein